MSLNRYLLILFLTVSLLTYTPLHVVGSTAVPDTATIAMVDLGFKGLVFDGDTVVLEGVSGAQVGDVESRWQVNLEFIVDIDGDFSTGYYYPLDLSSGGYTGVPGIDVYIYVYVSYVNDSLSNIVFYVDYAYANGSYAGSTYVTGTAALKYIVPGPGSEGLSLTFDWEAIGMEWRDHTGASAGLSPILYVMPDGVLDQYSMVYEASLADYVVGTPVSLEEAVIAIDDDFSDWLGVSPAAEDPFSGSGSWSGGADVSRVYLAANESVFAIGIAHGGPMLAAYSGRDVASWYVIMGLDADGDGATDVKLQLQPSIAIVRNLSSGIIKYLGYGNGYLVNANSTSILEIALDKSLATNLLLSPGDNVNITELSVSNRLTSVFESTSLYAYQAPTLSVVDVATGASPAAGPVSVYVEASSPVSVNVTVYEGLVPSPLLTPELPGEEKVLSVYFRVSDTAGVEWPIVIEASVDGVPADVGVSLWTKTGVIMPLPEDSYSVVSGTILVELTQEDYLAGDPLVILSYTPPLIGGLLEPAEGGNVQSFAVAGVIVFLAAAVVYRFSRI